MKTASKIIKNKIKKATGEKVLFEALWAIRPHVSFISGLPVNAISTTFAHVLAKGQGKYPKFKLFDKNIVFLTIEEHHLFDNGSHTQRGNYTRRMKIEYGVGVDWKKLYDLKEELIKEYNGG